MREVEGLQSSYDEYKTKKELSFMTEQLQKEGKLIK